MGFTLTYLSLVVLIPLAALGIKATAIPQAEFWQLVTSSRAIAAFRLTILASLAGAMINAVFGFIVAWCLVRYRFPGSRILDALVDLPFALPTAVSGIALTTLYAQTGWVGRMFAWLGIQTAYSPLGIVIALTFVGLPFVVRTLQPALEELESEVEEAAASLGASPWQSFFRVILPILFPSLLTGFGLAFARALGEYGSVAFISGNLPMKTEVIPLLIMTQLEQHNEIGATAIGMVALGFAFVTLLCINSFQWWLNRRYFVGA